MASKIIWRESPQYEEARVGRLFNRKYPDRYPRGIIEACCVQDVVDTIKLAKEKNLRVSVRSGGHSWAAWSVRDDAILIDLGKLNQLDLDTTHGLLKLSPSTTNRVLDTYLASKDKFFPGGHCPDVGVGGFLLGGGVGWNCKNWGWGAEQIKAIEVVTAEGKTLTCSEHQHSDLFWAARGAGPGFPAIATSFHVTGARDKFTAITQSAFTYRLTEYKTVMDWVAKIAPQCDDSIEVVAISLRPDPTQDPIIVASFTSFQYTKAAAEASLKIANDSRPAGAIMEEVSKATTMPELFDTQAQTNPEGHRWACDNVFIDNAVDPTEAFREAFSTIPAGTQTYAAWCSMAPTSRRKLPSMATSLQADNYLVLYAIWEDAKDDDRCQKWVEDVISHIGRQSIGSYVLDTDFQVRTAKLWNDSNGKTLMELRRKWDPKGLICGYLDEGDNSGLDGLPNVNVWDT